MHFHGNECMEKDDWNIYGMPLDTLSIILGLAGVNGRQSELETAELNLKY